MLNDMEILEIVYKQIFDTSYTIRCKDPEKGKRDTEKERILKWSYVTTLSSVRTQTKRTIELRLAQV